VHLIDVPGHSRLRGSALEKWARNGRGVVFVIDSATFIQQTKDVAAYVIQSRARPSSLLQFSHVSAGGLHLLEHISTQASQSECRARAGACIRRWQNDPSGAEMCRCTSCATSRTWSPQHHRCQSRGRWNASCMHSHISGSTQPGP
jgi:hypothetical protein